MCTKLLYIIFDQGSKLKTIGASTFFGCSQITEIRLPDELDSIGSLAFKGCEKLCVLEFGSMLRSIGISSFERCPKLSSVALPVMTERVQSRAFKGCSGLRTVWLPNSLLSLESESFADCSNIVIVETCVSSQTEGFSSSAFSGHPRDTTAVVSMSYAEAEFCGIRAWPVLDHQCNFPTKMFTFNDGGLSGDQSLCITSVLFPGLEERNS